MYDVDTAIAGEFQTVERRFRKIQAWSREVATHLNWLYVTVMLLTFWLIVLTVLIVWMLRTGEF